MNRLQEAADAETAKDAAEAEAEWRQAAGSVMLRDFSAKPTVGLRPGSGSGMDVVVRFVTRASERFERRNRLYEAMMAILREASSEPSEPALAARRFQMTALLEAAGLVKEYGGKRVVDDVLR